MTWQALCLEYSVARTERDSLGFSLLNRFVKAWAVLCLLGSWALLHSNLHSLTGRA